MLTQKILIRVPFNDYVDRSMQLFSYITDGCVRIGMMMPNERQLTDAFYRNQPKSTCMAYGL